MNRTKSIGILGGMGPLATCDLMKKIIMLTEAKKDQDYPRILVDCNTEIPDRTDAILHKGISPLPFMLDSIKKLKVLGADFIVISCNTAHFFIKDLVKHGDVLIVNMVEETVKEIKSRGFKKVGILGTEGTLQAGIYIDDLEKSGIEYIIPNAKEQSEVMRIIYKDVKSGSGCKNINSLVEIVDRFKAEGAEAVIMGCTEIPLIFGDEESPLPTIDPTIVLARRAVERAGYRVLGEV